MVSEPPFSMNLLHYLSIPYLLSMLNDYYRLISMLLYTLLLWEYHVVQVVLGKSISSASLSPDCAQWPIFGQCMYIDCVKADSSLPDLDQSLCSHLPSLLWHSVVAALSFLNMQCGTLNHDIMGHCKENLVNFKTKTMAHVGWKMSLTHDFCSSLSGQIWSVLGKAWVELARLACGLVYWLNISDLIWPLPVDCEVPVPSNVQHT